MYGQSWQQFAGFDAQKITYTLSTITSCCFGRQCANILVVIFVSEIVPFHW